MKVPITQSELWHNLQEDLGEKSIIEQGRGFQYLAIVKTTPMGNYLYCPYGPVAKDTDGFKRAIDSLTKKAREHQAIFIRIEPINPDYTKTFPRNTQKTTDLNPKETWLLDLIGSDDELKAKLPSRLFRYYKNAEKKGITIETSNEPNDIRYLLNLQKALASKKGISTFSEKYLQTELAQPFATLYLVKLGDAGRESAKAGNVIAAGLVFDDDTTRYNLQGAQSDEGRRLHATGILTIQLILDAKAKGLQTFDFWGIAPENAPETHPWAGFTNFKKTFAGYQEDHAGTYDIVLKCAKYKLYQALRKANRLRRH